MGVLTKPNKGKELGVEVDGYVYERYPVQTRTIVPKDDLLALFKEEAYDFLQDGDVVLIAESVISIAQGRAFKFDEIPYTGFAKFLSFFIKKTPYGIGLGTPQTMQLAINEVGLPRIVVAAIAAVFTKPFGVRGVFYRIAGEQVRGIDGPTSATLPPYNEYASLIPKDAPGFARMMRYGMRPKNVHFVVVDANDIGVNILGCSHSGYVELAKKIAYDNPMGQSDESTPFLICRKL